MKKLIEARTSDLVNKARSNPRWLRKNNYEPRLVEYTLNPLYAVFKVGKYEVDFAYNDNCKTADDVRNTLSNGDVHVACQCADMKYRFAYYSTKDNYGLVNEHRPPKITNPHNALGPHCKHIDAVLAKGSWKRQIIRDVENEARRKKDTDENSDTSDKQG